MIELTTDMQKKNEAVMLFVIHNNRSVDIWGVNKIVVTLETFTSMWVETTRK